MSKLKKINSSNENKAILFSGSLQGQSVQRPSRFIRRCRNPKRFAEVKEVRQPWQVALTLRRLPHKHRNVGSQLIRETSFGSSTAPRSLFHSGLLALSLVEVLGNGIIFRMASIFHFIFTGARPDIPSFGVSQTTTSTSSLPVSLSLFPIVSGITFHRNVVCSLSSLAAQHSPCSVQEKPISARKRRDSAILKCLFQFLFIFLFRLP